MASEGYLIGPGIRDSLRTTIARVHEMPYGKEPTRIPTRFEAVERPGGARLRLGKTTATWTKGTLATIPLWEEGTAPNETASGTSLEGCVNKFATVQTNKWVGMLRGPGGKHYLIAAEC